MHKLHGSIVIELQLLLIKVLHCEISIFDHLCSCDLDPDPMTFMYEHDLYPPEIWQRCENELPTSRLLKVII